MGVITWFLIFALAGASAALATRSCRCESQPMNILNQAAMARRCNSRSVTAGLQTVARNLIVVRRTVEPQLSGPSRSGTSGIDAFCLSYMRAHSEHKSMFETAPTGRTLQAFVEALRRPLSVIGCFLSCITRSIHDGIDQNQLEQLRASLSLAMCGGRGASRGQPSVVLELASVQQAWCYTAYMERFLNRTVTALERF